MTGASTATQPGVAEPLPSGVLSPPQSPAPEPAVDGAGTPLGVTGHGAAAGAAEEEAEDCEAGGAPEGGTLARLGAVDFFVVAAGSLGFFPAALAAMRANN